MTMTQALPSGNAKTFNMLKVVTFLRSQQPTTVSDISQQTAIPIATVYRIIHALLAEGLVLQADKVSAPNGRQPTLFSINPSYACTICIIIEKRTITVGLADTVGQALMADSFALDQNADRATVLSTIDRVIFSLIERQWGDEACIDRMRAINVAAEADVDTTCGTIMAFSGAHCFDNFDVVDHFTKRFGVPTRADKLLNVEAIASVTRYCRYSFEHYVYLHIGVGFGAAIVVDGKIYSGAHHKVGELVRMKTPDGRSWEEAYNTSNLYQRVLRHAAAEPQSTLNAILMDSFSPSRSGQSNSLMSVLDKALDQGCPDAMALMQEAVWGWRYVIAQLHMFFDPEVVVIGGDISVNTPHVFDLIRRTLAEDEAFDGMVLPAEYETSLMGAVAQGATATLYDAIYQDLTESFVHQGVSP